MSHPQKLLSVLVLLLLIPISSQAQESRLKIIASFSILADVVQNVAGEAAEVTSLTPVGTDPHSFTPSPRNIAAVANADVVFITGINLEELLMEAIENAGGEPNIVVVSSCIEVIAADPHHEEEGDEHEDETLVETNENIDTAIAERCATHYAELEAEHDTEEAVHGEKLGALYTIRCDEHQAEGGEQDHEHGACDPHVWTDPENVMYWTLMIRDTLIDLDPDNAATYTQNAAAYLEQLKTLNEDFIKPTLLSVPEDQRILLTNHETLGYFAGAYGYKIVGTVIPGMGTSAEPSAATVAALIDLVRNEGVPAIFAENTVNANIAQHVAAESGAKFYTLLSDSLSGVDGEGYIDYMRYNVTTIVNALSDK